MKLKIFALLCVGVVAGCTDSNGAVKALEGAGYKDIQLTGYSFLSCSKEDVFSTGFKAVGPSGKHVSGAVCAGFLKGSTIRTN